MFIDKNTLLALFSSSMGNSEQKFIEYVESNEMENWTVILDEFKLIQSQIYNHIYKITEPNIRLSGTEIENISIEYCSENYTWMNEIGMKAINNWLVWMCWHEGILTKI